MSELMNKIEAILFISGKPVTLKDIAVVFGITIEEVSSVLSEMEKMKKNSGLNIKIFEDGTVQMVTNPYYGKAVSDFFNPEAKPKKLTKAALETLAITAYNQPVTKSEIESIRGVNVEKVIATLEEKNLIEICGKKNTIGTPNLYRVTDEFLSYFGIGTIEELPEYRAVQIGKSEN